MSPRRDLRSSLRTLHELVTTHAGSYTELVDRYLARGCVLFGMETGIASRIVGDEYAIEAVKTPLEGVVVDARFPLGDTYCAAVVRSQRTVAWPHVGAMPDMVAHPVYVGLRLESYISTPIRVDGVLYGTLNFSSQQRREEAFEPWELELIEMMAGALGRFIERAHQEAAREETLRELAASEARYRTLFDSSTDAVVLYEEDGTLVEANARFLEILGRDRAAVIGQRVQGLVPKVARQGDGLVESEITCRDGKKVILEITETHVTLGSRRVVLGILRDITARREAERIKAEYISVISHEIRTPLTAVRGALSLLASGMLGELSAEASRMVGIALSGGERLVRLVNDLLDLDKLEAGAMTIAPKPIPLAVSLEPVWGGMRLLADEAEARLMVRLPADLMVHADPDRLAQVVVNLVGNAISFSPPDGVVTITAYPEGASVVMEVIDEGPGIPEEEQEVIFARFHQTAARARQGGTGLGLPISRALVEAMGGRLGVRSQPGFGATFAFTLPAA
jgi:PAS domain S-box-containing protein